MGLFDSFRRLWDTDAEDLDDDLLETQRGLGTDEEEPDGPASEPAAAELDGSGPGVFGRIGRLFTDRDPDTWDNDRDGLSDQLEIRHGLDPDDADSDGDGWDDGEEVVRFTDPLDDEGHAIEPAATRSYGTGELRGVDHDDDGLSDAIEARLGGHDRRRDTDRDGIDDGTAAMNGLGLSSAVHDKPWPPGGDIADASLTGFLFSALCQNGDAFRMGAEAGANEANPDEWDSSELVQWAARQGGVDMVDGSWKQFQQVSRAGGEIDVDTALAAPGALVFRFSGDPTGARRPDISHVAISLGDGRVIEATEGGVRVAPAGDRFTHAGVIRAFEADEDFSEGFFAAELRDFLAREAQNQAPAELQPGEDLIELDPDFSASPDDGDIDLSGFDISQMLVEPQVEPVVELAPIVEPVATPEPEQVNAFTAIDSSVDALFETGFASNTDGP